MHERDAPMAEIEQMAQDQLRSAAMVENNISNPRNLLVPGDRHNRNREAMGQDSVNRDYALGAAAHQQPRILFDKVGFVAMVGAQIEITFAHQVVANSAHHHGVITIAQLRCEDSNHESALQAKRAGEEVRPIVELTGGFFDPLFGVRRNCLRGGRVVHDDRDGCRRELQKIGEGSQADRFGRGSGRRFRLVRRLSAESLLCHREFKNSSLHFFIGSVPVRIKNFLTASMVRELNAFTLY